MKTYLVIWKDENEIPRAWGHSPNEEQAEAEALAQLQEYRRGRPDVRGWHSVTKMLIDGQEIEP